MDGTRYRCMQLSTYIYRYHLRRYNLRSRPTHPTSKLNSTHSTSRAPPIVISHEEKEEESQAHRPGKHPNTTSSATASVQRSLPHRRAWRGGLLSGGVLDGTGEEVLKTGGGS
jgi:hypothetical protein